MIENFITILAVCTKWHCKKTSTEADVSSKSESCTLASGYQKFDNIQSNHRDPGCKFLTGKTRTKTSVFFCFRVGTLLISGMTDFAKFCAQKTWSNDDVTRFFSMILTQLIWECENMCKKRKRYEETIPKRPGRGGKKGRRWSQRKKGALNQDLFAWYRLIKDPDVSNVKSKSGKVYYMY